MHVELARALVPVVHDLTVTGGPVPWVVDDGWTDEADQPSAMLWDTGDSHGSGVSVPLGMTRPEQVVHVDEQVQDRVFEELQAAAATNWPRCRHHPDTHPLEAAVRDGAARWVCPRDGTAVAVIGGLR